MSGTDELFPGAAEHPGVGLPPTLALPDEQEPDRGRLGLFAFLFGMVATVGNLSGAATGLATVTALAAQLGDSRVGLAHIDWVIPFEIAVLIGGVLLGAAGLVLGIRATRLRSARVLGIIGAILGGLAVGTDLVVAGLVTVAALAPS